MTQNMTEVLHCLVKKLLILKKKIIIKINLEFKPYTGLAAKVLNLIIEFE